MNPSALSDLPVPSIKAEVTLRLDQFGQKRFETYRTERVRRGKRMVTKDVPVESWHQYGRVHLFCPAVLKWAKRELGIWIRVELPVDPLPTDRFRGDALVAHIAAASDDIFKALERQAWSNLYDDIVVWVPSVLPVPAASGSRDVATREIVVGESGARELDKWMARLSEGEKRFNECRRYILDHISEHSPGYGHIVSELRAAAYFLDACGKCDSDPWMAYRDTYPGRLTRSLEDLMARKSAASHGYKVDYYHVRDEAYNASFPMFWRSWPPF